MYKSVAVKIVATLLLSVLAVGLSIGMSLYNSAVSSNEKNLLYIATSLSKVIGSVANFDRTRDNLAASEGPTEATLHQIRDALTEGVEIGSTGEVLLLQVEEPNIRILLHQFTQHDGHVHPEVISPDMVYYDVFRQGMSGISDIVHGTDEVGHDVTWAFAPIAGTSWTVATERHDRDIREPFVRAGLIGAFIALLLAAAGGSYNYRTAIAVSAAARKAEQSAEAAQRQLEEALNVTQEGFALFDAEDRLVLCNDVYKDFYSTHSFAIEKGKTLEEILTAGLSVGAFPGARGREKEWLRERLAQHQATETIEQQLSDGRWLKISERRTKEGGIVGVRTEITELKEREIALRESEKRFKDFTNTASDWVWETDIQNRFCYTERGNRDETRFNPDLINMMTREQAAVEDTKTPKWDEHRRQLACHEPFRDFRYWTVAPNDTKRLISVSGDPVFDDNGDFRGYRGTGTDVTEDYENLQKLNEAEQWLRRVFENVTVGMVHADSTGRILAFNKAAEGIFGYTAKEVLGKNVSMLAAEFDRTRHDEYMRNHLESGKAKIIGIGREVTGVRKNKEEFPLNLGIARIAVGADTHFVASILDLSEQRMLESKLRQSQKMEAVGQLVGGVAHDFNNLLGIIIGNLDLMRRRVEPESRLEHQVDKALAAAQRGADLTRRLLNFSRQMPANAGAIDINETISGLHELIQKSLTKTVQVRLSLMPDLPKARADQGDLEDALTNLCINARDAMPNGGQIIIETAVIEIDTNQTSQLKDLKPGAYVEIDVSDTGTGIPAGILSRIFDPFFSTKEQGKGTGLGLSMVYGFAKRSNGSIFVYSEEGLGTTFKLFLPVALEGEGTEAGELSSNAEDSDLSGTEAVLIVDDEPDLTEIAVSIFSDFGYRTLVAHNGEDALRILRGTPEIALLFSDVVMPGGMDGYMLADKAKEARPNLKVCLASGFTGGAIQVSRPGQTQYPLLKKPYTNRALASAVRNLLNGDNTLG